MDVFFIFCNDQEQDVRTNANECLNKLINSKFVDHSARIQNELLKELLKNESHYSVVAALNRLTIISHLMRPSRAKTFFVSLIPCLIKLSEQTEDELIQESLNENIDILMQNFIKYGTDNEVTGLLDAFIKNLYLENTSCKRTAANSLTSICNNSKKKFDMIFWLLNELFKQLIENGEQNNNYLIGTFLCLKTLIPLFEDYHFQNKQDVNLDLSLNLEDKEIVGTQVNAIKQNLLLFYLIFLKELNSNDDNQVINVLLEFFQVLLKCLPKVFESLMNDDKFCTIEDDKKRIFDDFYSNKNDESNLFEYTLKMICIKFLVNNDSSNKLKSDEEVRVLVKSLALNCVAKLIEYKLDCLTMIIYQNSTDIIRVIDVLAYSNHQDSNLTGQSSLIVGSFIKSKLIQQNFNQQDEDEQFILELFLNHLYLALENKSSVHLKLVLNAIRNCINEIINSNSILNLIVIDLFRKLVALANHPYWLIRVELLELFSSLNYKSICFIERNISTKIAIDSNIQLLILNNVFYANLVDNDHRVRSSTIKNIIKLIPNLYFNNYTDSRNDEILAFAKSLNKGFKHSKSFSFNLNTEQYKKMNLFPDNLLPYHSFGFVFPFSENPDSIDDFIPNNEFNDVELNLKTIVSHLISNLLEKVDDRLTLTGLLEALAELTDFYPTTKYIESWNISKSAKLIEFLFTYLTSTQNAILDLNLHALFIKLITNLICGLAYNELKENSIFRAKSRSSIFERSFQSESILNKSKVTEVDLVETSSIMSSTRSDMNFMTSSLVNSLDNQNWGLLGGLNHELKSILSKVTLYFIRLLHVYSTIFGENSTETNRSFLTQVFKPNFSPLKRTNSKATELFEKSDLFKKFSENKEKHNSAKKEVQLSPQHLYTNDSNLIKLHDTIKKMYQTTMNTLDFLKLDPVKQNKLIFFFNEILQSFNKILELGNHHHFGKLADELMHLITSIFTVQSSGCIQFVRQLIKVLFGTNFASVFEFEYPNIDTTSDPVELEHLSYSSFITETSLDQTNQTNINLTNDLYSICLLNNYEKLKDKLSSLNECSNSSRNVSKCDLEKEYYHVFYRKLFDKRLKSVLSQNYNDFINEQQSANYLQLIKPLIIDSMKNYTCRSDLSLHCSTLDLINELVKVHIKYSSLDEDQTFFTFLNKQFEFIENEQISSNQLVESMFGFLISLSYDKSSYALLSYPQIIQTMDNLQASDANFQLNVYPALSLIVEDLFLIRTISNSEDLKELETQKEFIINLLIKLAHLPKIIYLLNIILIEYKLEGEEKVKKLSRQITDQLLQNLVKGHVNFNDIDDVDIIMKLFLSVNPVVFRPVDFVLNGIFSLFDDNLLNNQTSFLKFYSHKLVLFNVLIGNSKEDIILNRLDELKINLVNLSIQAKVNSKMNDDLYYSLPIFCRIRSQDKLMNLDSKEIIAKYLIKLVMFALEQLVDCDQMFCNDVNVKFKVFLSQLLNQLLMNINFIVKDGQFPKISKCMENSLREGDCLLRMYTYASSLCINYPILIVQFRSILIELDLQLGDSSVDKFVDLDRMLGKVIENSNLKDQIDQQKNSILFKLVKNYPVNDQQLSKHLYSPQLELIRRIKYLFKFNHLVENANYLKDENWLNEENVLFFIIHNKQQSVARIFKLISLDADLSAKFIKTIGRMDLSLQNLDNLANQRIPILTVERLLVFCSLLHEKSNHLLIEYLLSNLYLNPKFISTVALRKTMLQIVNQKLKGFSFIRNSRDDRLSKEQIIGFIQQLRESNSCGLKKCLEETIDYLNDYLSALDLSIEPDNGDLDTDRELNSKSSNQITDNHSSTDCVDREKIESHHLDPKLNHLDVKLNEEIGNDVTPNQSWLIDVLLNNTTFNKSNDLFIVLNSSFSVHELMSMLENQQFTRRIEFSTNAFQHMNSILEQNLNYDTRPHTSSFQILKTSKFSLVLAVRRSLIKLCNELFSDFNLNFKSSSPTYFAYLNREELLFDREVENFNRITSLYASKENRKRLVNLSRLMSSYLEHVDLVFRIDQVRKRTILNNQQDALKNDENLDKLIKIDQLDYNLLLRMLMLYCELMQFEISTRDENYVNDCMLIIRTFVESEFLMNILASYQYNSMQFTLITALHSYYKKRFDLYSLNSMNKSNNFIPKHFQPTPDEQLKYKHSHNACLKMSEIINFILKQSTELICKENHLLQNRKQYSEIELDHLVYVTLIVARLPLINTFILVPSEIWRNDQQPNFVTFKQTKDGQPNVDYYEADTFCATLPSEQLFDPDTLQTFINLINLVGFTNRIQFEEIWMSLLGVISLNNDFSNSLTNEELFVEEVNEKANLIVLAIKGITSIILQCSSNEIGFPIKNLKQKPINRITDCVNDDFTRKKVFLNTKYGTKLLNLNKHLEQSSNIKFAGLDKDANENYFESLILGDLNYNYLNLVQFTEHFYENRYGLYSSEYMKKRFGLIKDLGELSINESSSSSSSSSTPVHQLNRSDSVITATKEEAFIKVFKNNRENSNQAIVSYNRLEIDVNSCIYFLLDLYSSMFKTHIAVQEEVLKSLIKISDLFFDLNQFNKNIEQFFDLFKTAFSQEDEILIQYLILGICKFYTITHETVNDNITLEKTKKCIEISLKSQFLSTRINCLIGLNYLLQDKLNAINKGRPSQTKDNPIFLMLKDYVLKSLFEKNL